MSLFLQARFLKNPIRKPTNAKDLEDLDCLKIIKKSLQMPKNKLYI